MGQRHARGDPDVLAADARAAVPRGVGCGRAGGDDVGAHAVHVEARADPRDGGQRPLGEPDPAEDAAGGGDPLTQGALVVGVRGGEPGGVGLERDAAAHHLGPQFGVARRGHLHGETETVQQLRAELALLGIHGADQHETGGVLDRQAIALDGDAAHRGGVEELVHHVVVEQIDLVHVEDPAVGASEQAGLEHGHAVGQRALQVQRPGDPVLGHPDRKLDQADRPPLGGSVGGDAAVGGLGAAVVGRGGEAVAGDHLDLREDSGEGADHRGLGRALLTTDEDAADLRRHRGEGEGQRHVVGTDNGAEGVVQWHGGSRSRLPGWSARGRSPDFPAHLAARALGAVSREAGSP